MFICINCGVELDENFKECPLCGRDPRSEQEKKDQQTEQGKAAFHNPGTENRKYLWELSGIITFSGIVICTIVDLLTVKGLSWSLLSDVSLLAVWTIITLFHYFYRQPFILVPGLLLSLLGFLFLTDRFAPGIRWFFPVALPVTIALAFSVAIIIALYKVCNFKGLNIIASGFLVLSGFCIITEIVLDRFFSANVDLRWSLITAVSTLPFASVLFFYHYRLKKGKQLDSFFHI